MSKIIELWRANSVPGLPVRFTVGSPPMFVGPDNTLTATDGPAVAGISFIPTIDKVHRAPCYVIAFVESKTKRLIPAPVVIDLAYENPKKEGVNVPPLEE